jgi:hypothetical protein
MKFIKKFENNNSENPILNQYLYDFIEILLSYEDDGHRVMIESANGMSYDIHEINEDSFKFKRYTQDKEYIFGFTVFLKFPQTYPEIIEYLNNSIQNIYRLTSIDSWYICDFKLIETPVNYDGIEYSEFKFKLKKKEE